MRIVNGRIKMITVERLVQEGGASFAGAAATKIVIGLAQFPNPASS
jgi:hypothetical protein